MEGINPAADTAATTLGRASGPARGGAEATGRILVVDDVADNRDILTRRLTRRGFDVIEADGGLKALEVLGAEAVDLVLLDIMMPDLDGTEVVRKLRETRSASELPIIMVSAKSQSEDVAQSLELGANDYVTKPVDFTVALARIKTQIERKRRADEEAREREGVERRASTLERDVEAGRETLRRAEERLGSEAEGRRASERQLEYLAYHDPLTGLGNRTAFRRALEEALRDAEAMAQGPELIFVDLDRFKPVNDVHGHPVGDGMLAEVGRRLSRLVGEAGTVARLGGDEFAVLLAAGGAAGGGLALARRIVEAVSEPFEVEGLTLRIGASCGVAPLADCDPEVEAVMKAADLAMYQAKAEGRGRVALYEARLLEEQRARSAVEMDLGRAIELGQMEVYYQPLVRTTDKQLSCFEALVRWNHPERGIISPGLFIPIAEETGVINQIGLWVLEEACREAASWPVPLRIAVNLSPVQFAHDDLIDNLRRVLAATGLPPQRLELEITESGLLDAGDRNVAILEAIRDLRIRVSIDDFGTGYSSMSYLQNFVFDKLKIDRRFVEQLSESANSAAIVDAIVRLSAAMGIDTTAEGIETEDQLAAVVGHGCSEVQGYLVSRPLRAADARAFIEDMMRLAQDSTAQALAAPVADRPSA